ncbi:hypothetical protein GE115_08340 [Agromyces sp. CFH 90414]|uniref:Uncharacterized protein n=1 Tax=Agromyces agglutinans TaxID=2662258 RepID=A0A6I2FBQ4_9MICO|nr:hypothetical protein [Agromyces agglutinans]MRG59876.1 hypothetical protein [Agromyces agglutinans]
MEEVAVVTLEPWHPWPLVFPAIVLATGAVMTFTGHLRERRWVRDIGMVLVVGGGLAGLALLGLLSGSWDQAQRAEALVGLGYEQPTFSGGDGIVGGAPGVIDFHAQRDGELVVGRLVPLGDAQWQVVEGFRDSQPKDSGT